MKDINTTMDDVVQEGASRRHLVYIPIDKLFPHPDNPRKDLGDLTELADSIRTNGVMQNLTVVENIRASKEYERMLDGDEKYSQAYKAHAIEHAFQDDYTVVIGHRRLAAAKEAGLTELPCVVSIMTYEEQIATMMTENLQRVDLTIYEQAQCLRQLTMDLGMSVDRVSQKTGFSTSTVRRRLKLCDLDQDTLKEVSGRQISMKDFEQLDKIDDPKLRNKALKEIGTANFNRECVAAMEEEAKKKKKGEWRRICLEAGLTEISEGVGNKRDKYATVSGCIYSSTPDRSAIEKYLSDDRELFFYVDRWSYVYIVTPKSEEDQASSDKRKQKEEQETVERGVACARLAEAFKRAERLRTDFIRGYSETMAKVHMINILRMGIECNTLDETTFDTYTFLCMIGYTEEELEDRSDYPEWDEIKDTVKGSPYKTMLAYVFASFAGVVTLFCYDNRSFMGHKGEYCNEGRGYEMLTVLYENLKLLGYEMSDEEKALMDGTSELYYRKEKEDANND